MKYEYLVRLNKIQQSYQASQEERKHILSDLNITLAKGGPDHELTEKEFNKTLRRSGNDTAHGLDKIRYSDIKNLTEEVGAELYTIFQESFDKGYIPEDWTDSFLRPIPKARKDYHKLNGYRILTMQNTIGKLMERIIARKLSRHLDDREMLPAHQERLEGGGGGGGGQTRKMQLHLRMTCTKDSRGRNKQWLNRSGGCPKCCAKCH